MIRFRLLPFLKHDWPVTTAMALQLFALSVSGAEENREWRLATACESFAKLSAIKRADGDQSATRVSFQKNSAERRFLALEWIEPCSLAGPQSLEVRSRATVMPGEKLKLALTVFEKDGESWFKTVPYPTPSADFTDLKLSLASLRRTDCGSKADEKLDWTKVEKIWLGLLLDGAQSGSFDLSLARFSAESFVPSLPVAVVSESASQWSVTKDPAAQGKVSTPRDGPEGMPCMKFDFTFPLGRHMYALPSVGIGDLELDGFNALRFTYRAELPTGIAGLLISLIERDGSQYCAEPPPPASAEWKTITLPFAQFRLGGWSKDENQQLDIHQIGSVMIGVHGTATGSGGKGTIWAVDIAFAP